MRTAPCTPDDAKDEVVHRQQPWPVPSALPAWHLAPVPVPAPRSTARKQAADE
ncbi:MAG: hypothetical protein ACRDOI_06560 [Trebonia sp.]